MKKVIGLFLLVLVWSCASEKFDKPRKKPKWVKMETPPGTVWLSDSLFIDETEIANVDYLQFVYWVKRNDSARYSWTLPDTLVWIDRNFYGEPYVVYYLRLPGYQDYPVVGVSIEQAKAYCDWRTDRVNEMMYVRDTKGANIPIPANIIVPKKVRYRLPTIYEWEYAALSGLDYFKFPFGYESFYGGKYLDANLTRDYHIKQGMDSLKPYSCLMPNASGKVSRFRIYNMLGNVSELTSDSLIKGLNFLTNLNGTSAFPEIKFTREPDSLNLGYTIKSYMKYEKPTAWLGFRCVCEVLP